MLGAGGVASLAGCSGDGSDGGDGNASDGGDGEDGGGDTTTEETTTTAAEKSVGGNFVWGTTSEATSIHPWDLDDEATSYRLAAMFDGGGVVGEDVDFESRWFKSWNLSDSADVVEYELRDGLQWGGDFGQLTAEDYLYNINEAWQVEDNWSGWSYTDYTYIEGEPITYEKTGKLSFRAELPAPRANYLHTDILLGAYPVPVALLEKYAGDKDMESFKKDEDITGGVLSQGNLGAFTFQDWTRNSKLSMSRNGDYYLGNLDSYDAFDGESFENAPYFENLTFQVFDEASTGYSGLKAGDLSQMEIEARKKNQFESQEGVELWQSKYGTGIFWLNLNHRINGWKPLRESREVRQAFAHLFDKQTLIENIFRGNANPVDTFHPKWGPYYDEEKIFVPEFGVEKAKQKLTSGTPSGYSYDGDTFVDPDGNQVTLTLVYRAGSQSNKIVANYVKQQLKKVGIKLNSTATEWSNLLASYAQTSASNVDGVEEADWTASGFNGGPWDQAASKEDWDLMYGLGFSHGAYSPWSVVRSTLSTKGSFNFWGYHTDQYDIEKACNDAQSATNQSEATEILSELFGFLSEEQPLIWWFNDHTILGLDDRVAGLEKPENAFSSPEHEREMYFAQN
jgi:peptide/nickel transport system substrate-binding protein